MNYALQNALTGLLSVLTLYVILAVVGKAIALYLDISVAMNRRKDLEMFARVLGDAAKDEKKDNNVS